MFSYSVMRGAERNTDGVPNERSPTQHCYRCGNSWESAYAHLEEKKLNTKYERKQYSVYPTAFTRYLTVSNALHLSAWLIICRPVAHHSAVGGGGQHRGAVKRPGRVPH